MTNFRFDPPAASARPAGPPPMAMASVIAIADADGVVWAHPNPVELYRWVSRRNELLKTFAAAGREFGGPAARALAG